MALYGKNTKQDKVKWKNRCTWFMGTANKNDLLNNFLHDIVIWVCKGKYLQSSVNSVSTFWIWPWPSFSLENPLYFLKVGIVWRAQKVVLNVR